MWWRGLALTSTFASARHETEALQDATWDGVSFPIIEVPLLTAGVSCLVAGVPPPAAISMDMLQKRLV